MHISALLLCTTFAVIVSGRSSTDQPSHDDHADAEVAVKKFYGSLNTEEKTALKEYAKELKEGRTDFSLTNGSFLDGIKEHSEGLFSKMIGLRDAINSKLDGLKPETRLFITNVLRRLIVVFGEGDFMKIVFGMKNLGKDVLKMYDTLDENTRQDVMNAFPTIGSIATSDITRVLLNKLADFNFGGSSAPSNPSPPITGGGADEPEIKQIRTSSARAEDSVTTMETRSSDGGVEIALDDN